MTLSCNVFTYVGVGVPVEYLQLPASADVPKKVTIGRFVSAAEHNHEGASLDIRSDRIPQLLLVGLHVTRDLEVAQIPGSP